MSHKCQSILRDRKGVLRAEMASLSYDFQDRHLIPEHFHPEHQLVFAVPGHFVKDVMGLNICFGRGQDGSHPPEHLGGSPFTRGVDSSEDSTRHRHVGRGFDENLVLSSRVDTATAARMFCVIRVGAVARADPARLYLSETQPETSERKGNHRDSCGSAGSGACGPLAVAAPRRSPRDESGASVA